MGWVRTEKVHLKCGDGGELTILLVPLKQGPPFLLSMMGPGWNKRRCPLSKAWETWRREISLVTP